MSEQQAEMVALLDLAKSLRMNTVVLQVRPACDAMYRSQLEPWSEYLTGKAGRAPGDGFDPLEFAVAEAHKRGLELHAWFNPYRAWHPSAKSPIPPNHISKTQADVVRRYGEYHWLDPGEPAAKRHSLEVILDVVRRYDIDAVHFDDYFYPYPIVDENDQEVPFPDDKSWKRYEERTEVTQRLSRDDWRRENVNQFLKQVASGIKEEKPWVRFGVSPFGIYRPGQPESIQGFDAYSKLYADSKKWLVEGGVDYMSPQLYWPIDQKAQSFPVLLDWWKQHNPHRRHLWPGLYTSRVLPGHKGWSPTEIARQIELVRSHVAHPGHIHFSIKAIQQDRSDIRQILSNQVYSEPAIPPATTWCRLPESNTPEPSIAVSVDAQSTRIEFQGGQSLPWLWIVQCYSDGKWSTQIVPGQSASCTLACRLDSLDELVVRPVDRLNRIGETIDQSTFEMIRQ